MAKGDIPDDEQASGVLEGGGPFATDPHSTALGDERTSEPTALCPQCGCPDLMHCGAYRKCPMCSWREDT